MFKKEAPLAFPDFDKPFNAYTDASVSDRQLGATVVQKDKPLGFYTRKLILPRKTTLWEKELYQEW